MSLCCFMSVCTSLQKFPPHGWDICAAASGKVSMSFVADDIYMQTGLFFLIPFIIITSCYVHTWITTKQCRINRDQAASRLTLEITVGLLLWLAPYIITLFIQSLIRFDVLKNTVVWLPHYVGVHCRTALLPLLSEPVPCIWSTVTLHPEGRDGRQTLNSMAVIPYLNGLVQNIFTDWLLTFQLICFKRRILSKGS